MVMEYTLIGIVVVIQLWVFLAVLGRIYGLGKVFSNVDQALWIEPVPVPHSIFRGKDEFDDFIDTLNDISSEEPDEGQDRVDVIKFQGVGSKSYREIIRSINSYLLKNRDASPDFTILKDITERKVNVYDEAISNQIAVPLYIGLAGTFLGIVMGLWGLNFQSNGDTGVDIITIASGDIQALISGVRVAMIASFLGLILTVINQALFYKRMTFRLSRNKNEFYDLLQRDLLPRMGQGIANTLKSFQQNLDLFNIKFGSNLKSYERNFELIHENLRKQDAFLKAVQEIGVVNLSNQIVQTFEKIDQSAQTFQSFVKYQEELNNNVVNANAVVKDYKDIFEKFNNFNINLERIVGNIDESLDFYQKFKVFLERHFSELDTRKNVFVSSIESVDKEIKAKFQEMAEHSLQQSNLQNEQWRKMTGNLNEDVANVFKKLSVLIEEESKSLKEYIATEEKGLHIILKDHQEAFRDVGQMKPLFDAIKNQLVLTHEHYEGFHKDFGQVTEFLKENSKDLKLMNKGIQDLNKNMFMTSRQTNQKVNQ